MLKGRSATIFYTFGGHRSDLKEAFVDPIKTQIKNGILSFVGFENVQTHCLYKTLGIENLKARNDFVKFVGKTGKIGG
jgi:putative NADPH-quinone reductase